MSGITAGKGLIPVGPRRESGEPPDCLNPGLGAEPRGWPRVYHCAVPIYLIHRVGRILPFAAAVALACVLAACESGPPPRTRDVPVITRDIPPILRNTIGAESSLTGDEPIVMTGYGLVVGLRGTGSNDVPLPVRTYMVDQMTRMGVGKERGTLRDVSPDELLDDPNTAVVVVQAVVPPGAPEGWKFDVRVDAVPGSSTRSLEGGMLWTCELRRGVISPNAPSTPALARVYGPIFTNPFARPGSDDVDAVDKRTGFVMNGGQITAPWPLTVILDSPSHSRARAIVAAINARFGRDTARGINEDSLQLKIPERYRERPEVFVRLLKHTRIDQAFPEEIAQRYVDTLKEQPELAEQLSWCLTALGDVSIPFVRTLYDSGELRPRLAAVQAGARLADPTVRSALEELIKSGPSPTRTQMIGLLSELPPDPKVSSFLRELLDAPDMDVRVAAYEALDERGDGVIRKTQVAGKFLLHQVPSSEPAVYITQFKAPKIVLFGDADQINQPSFVSGWDGRLMVDAKAGSKVKVFYRDPMARTPVTGEIDASLPKLINFLAHKPSPESPEPGLDLSYSQTVSALNEIVRHGGVSAPIVPEQDKLALEMLRANQSQAAQERPELSEQGPLEALPSATAAAAPTESSAPGEAGGATAGGAAPGAAVPARIVGEDVDNRPPDPEREKRKKKYVVPLNPTVKGEKKPK